jgi:hypothetical protein
LKRVGAFSPFRALSNAKGTLAMPFPHENSAVLTLVVFENENCMSYFSIVRLL